jgi:large subunit ribosomal protein L24
MPGMKIRREDTVRVIAGKDRGKTGRVLRVDPKAERVYVEGMNIQKRHHRPRTMAEMQRGSGGVIEQEGPIHVSNVMLVDPSTNQPTRVGITREGGVRRRVARRSGEVLD